MWPWTWHGRPEHERPTDAQAWEFSRIFMSTPSDGPTGRAEIEALTAAGWTIEPPPEPRFYVKYSSSEMLRVVDRSAGFLDVVASFTKVHPDAAAAAQAEADRLNAEDRS